MPEQNERTAQEKIFDFLTDTGIPLARSLIYGGQQSSEAELAAERNYYNRLNGSGAPDSRGNQATASRSVWDQFFGAPVGSSGNAAAQQSPMSAQNLAMLVVAGLIVWFITKRL